MTNQSPRSLELPPAPSEPAPTRREEPVPVFVVNRPAGTRATPRSTPLPNRPRFRARGCRSPGRARRRRDEEGPAPSWRKGRSQVRWRWRRWWRGVSLEDVVRDVALAGVHVEVRVADIVVPNHRIHLDVSGLHRGIARAPTTWAGGAVRRAPWPTSQWHRTTGEGLGGARGQTHTGHRNAQRHQRTGRDPFHRLGSTHDVFLPLRPMAVTLASCGVAVCQHCVDAVLANSWNRTTWRPIGGFCSNTPIRLGKRRQHPCPESGGTHIRVR